MHCFVPKAAFYAFRDSHLPPIADPEAQQDAIWKAGAIRLEATGNTLRARTVHGLFQVPARVERPGVCFLQLWDFLESVTNPGYLDEPEDEFMLNATEERLWTLLLCCSNGDDYLLFPDPATAPETWDYTAEREDADLADAD